MFIHITSTLSSGSQSKVRLSREDEEKSRRQNWEFDFNKDIDWFEDFGPFDGIISYLSEECGGNVHVKGVVDITPSSNNTSQCHHVTAYRCNRDWCTQDEPNSWICFDFKEKTVRLTKYSLRSGVWFHPLHWVVEGSSDGESWNDEEAAALEMNAWKELKDQGSGKSEL